jgi:hypothetical protein
VSIDFLVTSLIVVVSPGTGVLCTSTDALPHVWHLPKNARSASRRRWCPLGAGPARSTS